VRASAEFDRPQQQRLRVRVCEAANTSLRSSHERTKAAVVLVAASSRCDHHHRRHHRHDGRRQQLGHPSGV